MKTPAIIVNFKTYREATGKAGLELAKICDRVSKERGVEIVVCPQLSDAQRVRESVEIPVFAQHVDAITPGSHTGWILPEAISEIGLDGSLINHSEHRIEREGIRDLVKTLRRLRLTSVVCSRDVKETGELSALSPDYMAIEPPELIGSGVSVSTARPEVIKGAVEVSSVPVLCGAGITRGIDVKKALELGAKGVLLASGVVKSKTPEKVLEELANYALSV